jgi:hypothetical protein
MGFDSISDPEKVADGDDPGLDHGDVLSESHASFISCVSTNTSVTQTRSQPAASESLVPPRLYHIKAPMAFLYSKISSADVCLRALTVSSHIQVMCWVQCVQFRSIPC